MLQIFSKEINSFFNSLTAYLVIGVFLTVLGLLIWIFPDTNVLDYGYADLETLFRLGPYVFMFLIPAITMRSFSEERKIGTLELILTQPIREIEIIIGKFLAAFTIVLLTLLPTLIYYFSIYQLGNPAGNLDSAGIFGSYIGLLLLGGVFASIGIFSSSLTDNQVVAFIIAVFLSFVMYSGFNSIASINEWSAFSIWIDDLGILAHYNSLSKGLIDSRDLVYFLSVIVLMLLFTKTVLSSRKW